MEDVNQSNHLTSHANNIAGGDGAGTMISNSKGGGAGYHYPSEECNGMLRVWDGPLREVPICDDLNWCVQFRRVCY